MSILSRLRIKARIYLGFGALIVIGLIVAGFGAWQLTSVGKRVDNLSSISENASRNLQVSVLAQKARRLSLRYKTLWDDSVVKDFVDTQKQATELLAAAAQATLSENRRRLYNETSATFAAASQTFDKMVQLGAKIQADRAKLFSGGDQVAAGRRR
jgi:hypothetical protein